MAEKGDTVVSKENIRSSEDDYRAPTDRDWAERILCSDGNCIGVIGPDHFCKECGKPYKEELPGTSEIPGETETDHNFGTNHPDPVTVQTDEVSDDSDDDWENRVLCSDGACIGVIGPDGHCKECGKPPED